MFDFWFSVFSSWCLIEKVSNGDIFFYIIIIIVYGN